MNLLIILFATLCSIQAYAQDSTNSSFGSTYKIMSKNTSFPHKLRNSGHGYKGKHYSRENHYNDSTVFIFIPKYYDPIDSINFLFYFHGWWNNVDSSVTKFKLIEQFYRSKKPAILILPEGAKNAPDSFGGKLEEKNVFRDLVLEMISFLENKLNKKYELRRISLGGHSGAYQVMSYILLHGGVTNEIENVFLFDGLYGNIEKFSHWIDNYNGRFINIYTPNGGTKSESENLMMCLEAWGIPFYKIKNDNFSTNDLMKSKIIFIRSQLRHSEVIHTKNQFQQFIESSL